MKKLALVLVCALLSSALALGGETLDLDNPEDAVKDLANGIFFVVHGDNNGKFDACLIHSDTLFLIIDDFLLSNDD